MVCEEAFREPDAGEELDQFSRDVLGGSFPEGDDLVVSGGEVYNHQNVLMTLS